MPGTCVQNREEATATGRSCLRKCKQDSDCISARKRCLCDGLCGWSCVRPDLTCDILKQIDNGTFTITSPNTNGFSARVAYTCDKGFFISGPKERVCQGDGSWSGSPAVCTLHAECNAPPSIPHARANSVRGSFKLDSVVEYSCFVGYEPKGNNRTKCEFRNETIQWTVPDFKCIPRSCNPPGEIENGHRDGSQFTLNRRITFSCKEGFSLQGKSDIYCQSNGQWSSPLPHCTPISCNSPANPKNGRAIFSNTIFQSITRFECLAGFQLKGPSRAVCNTTGGWTNIERVICEPINCEPIGEIGKQQENVQIFVSTPSGDPTESSLDSNSHQTSYVDDSDLSNKNWPIGTVLQFRCAGANAQLSSANYSRCDEDAQWSHPIPSCMNSCSVPKLVNATILDAVPGQELKHSSTFRTECQDHYEIVYNDKPPICVNGSWSYLPVCTPERCKKFPAPPKHGIVFAPYANHGARGEFLCKDGYKLIGSTHTWCNYGEWMYNQKAPPICQEVYCSYPGNLENGRVMLVGSLGLHEYRPYVKNVVTNRQLTYECNKGFLLKGPPGSTCLNGEWQPSELPKCVPYNWAPLISIQSDYLSRKRRFIRLPNLNRGTCLLLKTNYSKVHPAPHETSSSGLIYSHGVSISIDCADGYLGLLGSNQTAICLDGVWRPTTPICKQAVCRIDKTVQNALYLRTDGHLLTPNGTLNHDQLINIKCLPGFVLKGANAVRCYLGELSAVFVHDVQFRKTKNCANCDSGKELIRWPVCVPEAGADSSNGDWNLEKRQIELMLEDDSDELKKLDKNEIRRPKVNYKQRWCTKPTRLKSLLKHIDKLKSVDQLKSKLIGIVELDHRNAKKRAFSVQKKSVYPPGSQLLYRCIRDEDGWLIELNATSRAASRQSEKSSWLLTCADGDWVGKRVPCNDVVLR